jgi:hypothetical protein
MYRNFALTTALRAAMTQEGGEGEGAEQLAQTPDGTVLPESLKNEGISIIQRAFEIHEQVVSVSLQLLRMAQKCATAAKGNNELALSMFKSALANAETKLRQEHSSKTEKAKVDEFLADNSSWQTYVKNIQGAFKLNLPIGRFKSESALRKAAKEARELQRGSSGGNANQTPEAKAKAEEKRVDTIAVTVAKEDPEIAEKLSVLLKGIKVVNLEEGNHKEKILNVLNQAIVAVNRLIPADTEVKNEGSQPAPRAARTGSTRHTVQDGV